jgi:hypothetical protein
MSRLDRLSSLNFTTLAAECKACAQPRVPMAVFSLETPTVPLPPSLNQDSTTARTMCS